MAEIGSYNDQILGAREQAKTAALLRHNMEMPAPGQMVGNIYVGNPWGSANAALSKILAGWQEGQANKKVEDLRAEKSAKYAELLKQFEPPAETQTPQMSPVTPQPNPLQQAVGEQPQQYPNSPINPQKIGQTLMSPVTPQPNPLQQAVGEQPQQYPNSPVNPQKMGQTLMSPVTPQPNPLQQAVGEQPQQYPNSPVNPQKMGQTLRNANDLNLGQIAGMEEDFPGLANLMLKGKEFQMQRQVAQDNLKEQLANRNIDREDRQQQAEQMQKNLFSQQESMAHLTAGLVAANRPPRQEPAGQVVQDSTGNFIVVDPRKMGPTGIQGQVKNAAILDGRLPEDIVDFQATQALANPDIIKQYSARDPRRAQLAEATTNKAISLGMSPDMANKKYAEWGGEKRFQQVIGNREGQAKTNTEALEVLLPLAKQASKDWQRGNFVPINKLITMPWDEANSNPTWAKHKLMLNEIASRYSKVMGGTGQQTDTSYQHAIHAMSGMSSDATYENVLDLLEQTAKIESTAPGQARAHHAQEKYGAKPEGNATQQPAAGTPKPGDIIDNHKFLGGDPAKPESWKAL